MAGGTGGHMFPGSGGRARRCAAAAGTWSGSAPRAAWRRRWCRSTASRIETIRFRGVRGKGLLRWALLPLALLVAFWQSARVIFRVRPDVVLGMGGFAAFPGGMMASFLNRPFVIHEQNAIAGLANRVLAQVADRVYAAFPERLAQVARGAAIRCAPRSPPVAPPEQRFAGRAGPLRLFVVGGSLGAQALNEAVPRALALLPEAERPAVIHQAGVKHIEALQAALREAGVPGSWSPSSTTWRGGTREADLVICRAGATTVAELGLRRRGERAGAVPVRHRRSSDGERAVSVGARRGHAGAAVGAARRSDSRRCSASLDRRQLLRWRKARTWRSRAARVVADVAKPAMGSERWRVERRRACAAAPRCRATMMSTRSNACTSSASAAPA